MRVVEHGRPVIVEQPDRGTVSIGLELGIADDAVIVGADHSGREHPVAGFRAGQQHIVEQADFPGKADRPVAGAMRKEDQLWPAHLAIFLEESRCGLRHHQRVELPEQIGVALQTAQPVERHDIAEHFFDQPGTAMRADRPEDRAWQSGIEKGAHRIGLPLAGGDDFDTGSGRAPLQRGNDRRDMGDLMQFVMIEQKADALNAAG